MTRPGLHLSLSVDGASRGARVREAVRRLSGLPLARGALLVAPDGFLIDAALPPTVSVEPLAALAAKLGPGAFSADEGALLIGATPIGFVALLGERYANAGSLRASLDEAVGLLHGAWQCEPEDARRPRRALQSPEGSTEPSDR